jgi:hypothetical protein
VSQNQLKKAYPFRERSLKIHHKVWQGQHYQSLNNTPANRRYHFVGENSFIICGKKIFLGILSLYTVGLNPVPI